MKIAQIAPIWITIPPEKYGGAELIISLLTEELVKRKHDVTLFASADSKTKAKLVSVIRKAPGLTRQAMLDPGYNMKHLFNMFKVLEEADKFDLIHWHFSKDIAPIMFTPLIKKPSLITIHNHFGGKDVSEVMNYYRHIKYFVSISNSHRKQFPFQFIDTVYNGIDFSDLKFNPRPKKYLVWLGRFAKMKGAHIAIKVALKLKMPLKLAAPRDNSVYFRKQIEPFLGKRGINYLGEVDSEEKNRLLRNAFAFLNPISWEEPFGLVVPEANACGTPIVAFRRGSMSEIIKNGVNGQCVKADDMFEMAQAVKDLSEMPEEEYTALRSSCRKFAEENFTATKMTDGYEKVYEKVLKDWHEKH